MAGLVIVSHVLNNSATHVTVCEIFHEHSQITSRFDGSRSTLMLY